MAEDDDKLENIYEQEEQEEQEEELVQVSNKDIFPNICIVQFVALIIAIIWGYFGKIFWWNNIKFDISLLNSLYILIGLFGFNAIFYIFRNQLKFMHYEWIIKCIYIPIFSKFSIGQCILISILSGFCEEALFRGVMSVAWGLIISSLVFGFLHLGNKKLIFSGIWIAIIGFCFAYVYKNTGNLGISILAHSLNNFFCFIVVKILAKKYKLL